MFHVKLKWTCFLSSLCGGNTFLGCRRGRRPLKPQRGNHDIDIMGAGPTVIDSRASAPIFNVKHLPSNICQASLPATKETTERWLASGSSIDQAWKTQAFSGQYRALSLWPWNLEFTPTYPSSAVKQPGHGGEFFHRQGCHPARYRAWIKLANMWDVLKPFSVSGRVASEVGGWEGSFSGPTPKHLI